MKKLLGLAVFLVILYGILLLADPTARSGQNHYNLAKRIGLFGILCLGVTPLIISGGIDLSIGSVVAFCATLLALLVNDCQWNVHAAVLVVLAAGAIIGIMNGLLVTLLRLQPFVVTLCGLFVYRGMARWMSGDLVKGPGDRFAHYKDVLKEGDVFGVPKFFLIMLVFAVVVGVFLHLSVYGRYFFAMGANEKTARYSGVRVGRYKLLAYVICSLFAAFFSVLYLTEYDSVRPSDAGSFYELYAIAGAVLGGVSLRGGEGHIVGVLIGITIVNTLPNLTRMWGISSTLEYTVIGAALLVGAIVDQLLQRGVAK